MKYILTTLGLIILLIPIIAISQHENYSNRSVTSDPNTYRTWSCKLEWTDEDSFKLVDVYPEEEALNTLVNCPSLVRFKDPSLDHMPIWLVGNLIRMEQRGRGHYKDGIQCTYSIKRYEYNKVSKKKESKDDLNYKTVLTVKEGKLDCHILPF